jgi:hypothetical protein
LYPQLAQRVATELNPPLTFEKPPLDFEEVGDAQRAKVRPNACLSVVGRAKPYRDVVWDDGMFRFLLRLDRRPPAPKAFRSASG